MSELMKGIPHFTSFDGTSFGIAEKNRAIPRNNVTRDPLHNRRDILFNQTRFHLMSLHYFCEKDKFKTVLYETKENLMKIYLFEGHDGAAKTPVSEGVAKVLREQGKTVGLYAPFPLVAKQLGHDIYLLWSNRESAQRAVCLLKDVMDDICTEARQESLDIVLIDRGWFTVVSELERRGMAHEIHWTGACIPFFFLEAPPQKTLACQRYSSQIPWTDSLATITEYHDLYLRLIADPRYEEFVLARYLVETRTQPLGPIIEDIVRRILQDTP